MKNLKLKVILSTVLMTMLVLAGCDALDFSDQDKTYQGDQKVKFVESSSSFTAFEPVDEKQIAVSHLIEESSNTSYTVSVDTEQSTAQEGVHFNMPSNSVTIPANEFIGHLVIELLQDELLEEKILVLNLDSPNTVISHRSITLSLAAFFEFERDNFLGEWELEYPWFYGPGTSNYVAVEGTAENSIIVEGMIDGTDIEIFFDDSDPNEFRAEIPATPNAWQHSAGPVSVEASGTFSTVTGSERIEMSMFHFIPGVGTFGDPTPFVLRRP
ncbi:MAG: DUF4843 domain-containing protein [Balneolaceae bacterium]|nr:MAG: DUF4843 domain-containing protein [Balneolaceae bacterium]